MHDGLRQLAELRTRPRRAHQPPCTAPPPPGRTHRATTTPPAHVHRAPTPSSCDSMLSCLSRDPTSAAYAWVPMYSFRCAPGRFNGCCARGTRPSFPRPQSLHSGYRRNTAHPRNAHPPALRLKWSWAEPRHSLHNKRAACPNESEKSRSANVVVPATEIAVNTKLPW